VVEDDKKPSFGVALDLITATLKEFDERTQRTMITTVCDLLQLKLGIPAPPAAVVPPVPTLPGTAPLTPPPAPAAVTDIRTLKTEKRPKSAQQMATLVALFRRHGRRYRGRRCGSGPSTAAGPHPRPRAPVELQPEFAEGTYRS
jgi:hypothetical protein